VLKSLAFVGTLRTDRLCATQRQVTNGARPRLRTAELSNGSGQLGIERDLYARLRGRHASSVPHDWYTISTPAEPLD